jgi:ABC-type transporter Mla MlaB component
MGRFRRAVRQEEWGHFIVVSTRGDLNATNSEELKKCVLEIQGAWPVILDLSDVSRCDPAGIATVRDVTQLLESQAWACAVVADPSGPCAEALESDPEPIETYPDRRAARSALHHAAL